jgi:hypothetical protein
MLVRRFTAEDSCREVQPFGGAADVIGEILTWVGVAIAALATYALYRSAVDPSESKDKTESKQHSRS